MKAEFYCIACWDGQVHPYQRNERTAHCTRCETRLEAGSGFRFYRARFGEWSAGYWCAACVELLLRGNVWAWNGFASRLYTAHDDILTPISGKPLAEAWRAGGYAELGLTLETMNGCKKKTINNG
ncbi:MAG: hypothetical protein LC138_07015 [Anaerolineales bacterium]|nr:hypothetical protein [Anaerolineales bacterium]